jgi:hypothetical protein
MPAINFITFKIKPLCELTARDVPPGLDHDDVAYICNGKCPKKRKKCIFKGK